MAVDNPYPAPAASVLADMCAVHAWSEGIDDHTRLLLEWSADTIRQLLTANNRLAQRAEQREAEAETYARALYGPNQKGGAA